MTFARAPIELKSGKEKPFADKLNATPNRVFEEPRSRTVGYGDEGEIVKRSAAQEVEKLRRRKGKDMVIWGSLSLAQVLPAEVVLTSGQR